MNNSQKTIRSALEKPGAELGILEADFRVPFPAEEIVYLIKGVFQR